VPSSTVIWSNMSSRILFCSFLNPILAFCSFVPFRSSACSCEIKTAVKSKEHPLLEAILKYSYTGCHAFRSGSPRLFSTAVRRPSSYAFLGWTTIVGLLMNLQMHSSGETALSRPIRHMKSPSARGKSWIWNLIGPERPTVGSRSVASAIALISTL